MSFWVRKLVCFTAALLGVHYGNGQAIKSPTDYSAEAGGYVSSNGRTPFWQQANQFGVAPVQSPALTLRVAAQADYDTARLHNRKVDYGYGARIVGNATSTGQILIPELYAKVRFGILEAYVGRRQEIYGLVDSTLSSGAYSWSGNALPLPRIQLAVPDFSAVPFTKGWVSFKGNFAHGWMNPTGFINHSMLHQKTLYLRIGKTTSRMRVYGGFTHQAVWGGRVNDFSLINNPDLLKDPKLPSRFRDYVYVVSGLRLPGPDDQNRLTNFDYTNRIGNHLGTIDVGADINLSTYNLMVYRQQIFDDGSLYYLLNIADGLNGIRLRKNKPDAIVRDVLVEFLNTTNQGGAEFVIDDPYRRGADNYFNHAQFRDGWSYRQRGIGTPFITPALGPNGEWPYGNFTNNNRVMVFHVGMAGSLPIATSELVPGGFTYQAKFSFSQNYGTYADPFRSIKQQFSGTVVMSAPLNWLKGVRLNTGVAFDVGQLYLNNIGLYAGVCKTWHKSR